MTASAPTDPPAHEVPISLWHLVELLAPALGTDKSLEMVRSTCRRLGYVPEGLGLDSARNILRQLGRQSGIVGIAARLAGTRLDASTKKRSSAPPRPARAARAAVGGQRDEPPSSRVVEVPRLSSDELARQLAHSLGSEKAQEVIRSTQEALEIASDMLTVKEVLAILDATAKVPGLVGVASRFAKARILLRFEGK